jgi:hypothetical protein
MAICRESAPPMFRTDPYRAAACFLYRDRAVVLGADIGAVMIPGDDAGPTRAPADEAAELRPGV